MLVVFAAQEIKILIVLCFACGVWRAFAYGRSEEYIGLQIICSLSKFLFCIMNIVKTLKIIYEETFSLRIMFYNDCLSAI